VVDAVELWTVELPFRGPVRTAQGAHRARPLLLVRIVGRTLDGPAASVEGWGECAALADTTFDAEDVSRSLAVLRHLLVPALLERVSRGDRADRGDRGDRGDRAGRCSRGDCLLPPPSDLEDLHQASPHAPLAFAALEMAVADVHLRVERRSLAGLLGVEGRRVQLGAVAGQADTTDQLVASVGELVEQGYSRVKLKIGPGWDLEPLTRVARAFPDLRLQVDANGSYRPGDGAHLSELDQFGLLCLEQPFDRSDLAAHVHQATRMSTPICLDESLDSPRAVDEALAMGACSVVCVKPSRLGGIGAALSVIERCSRSAVPLWMGGMFESGYARGVNTVLGALDGMTWPGDLSPSRTYLEDDLVPETPEVPPTRDGPRASRVATPPPGPGMGPLPDPAALARYGMSHQVIRVPGA
jgi:O-succinylbenzoate synthase